MSTFIGEEVEVRRAGPGGPPESFIWQGREYRVESVRRRWRQVDLRRSWWRRRHRDHYVVTTQGGEAFQLYHHRGFGRKYWVLYARMSP